MRSRTSQRQARTAESARISSTTRPHREFSTTTVGRKTTAVASVVSDLGGPASGASIPIAAATSSRLDHDPPGSRANAGLSTRPTDQRKPEEPGGDVVHDGAEHAAEDAQSPGGSGPGRPAS